MVSLEVVTVFLNGLVRMSFAGQQGQRNGSQSKLASALIPKLEQAKVNTYFLNDQWGIFSCLFIFSKSDEDLCTFPIYSLSSPIILLMTLQCFAFLILRVNRPH